MRILGEIANLVPEPAFLAVSVDTWTSNVRKLRSWLPRWTALFVAVKDEAYGLGAAALAPLALANGANGVVVARVSEAHRLRLAGVTAPIMNVGVPTPAEIDGVVLDNIVQCVGDFDLAAEIDLAAKRHRTNATLHLAVNTGMTRLECLEADAIELARRLVVLEHVRIGGVFTHFNTADFEDGAERVREQRDRFYAVAREVRRLSPHVRWIHSCNTAGLLQAGIGRDNLVRIGIGAYGYFNTPFVPNTLGLEPTATLVARVAMTRKMTRATSVGYGATYEARPGETLATIQAGYGDGVDRRAGNERSYVGVDGHSCPIVGRVSMDSLVARLPADTRIQPGSLAYIFGGPAAPSLTEFASRLDTLENEVLVRIPARVPRVYVDHDRVVGIARAEAETHLTTIGSIWRPDARRLA